MAEHLSVFVENKPGKLERITGILGQNGINLRAYTIASRGEFGVIKLLVDKVEVAADALKKAGIMAARREILIAEVNDTPGSLHTLLGILAGNNINIEDSYGFILDKNRAAIAFEIKGSTKDAVAILEKNGIAEIKSL